MNTLIKKLALVLTVLLALNSCEEFTEVDLPESQLASTSVFENESIARAALASIYAQMRERGFVSGTTIGGTLLLSSYSDDLDFYGNNLDIQQFSNHTVLASNLFLNELWASGYTQIYATNALLEGVEKSTSISTEVKNQLIGEALFLRSLIHFYLANLFGSIPYVTTTDYKLNSTINKTLEHDVYGLILSDLQYSESLVSAAYPSIDRVRVNKATVTALEARLYLYIGNWSDAESAATAIIQNPLYAWQPDVSQVFLKDSPSIIWSLHPGIAGLNTNDARTFAASDGPPTESLLSTNLYDEFELGDLRKTMWIKTVADGANTYHQAYKYKNYSSTTVSEEYTIVFRLAEQYLIRSEARAKLGNISGAQEDLNMIRHRAGLSDTNASTPADLLTAIIKERRSELFTEQGDRWLDLKRTGTAASALSFLKSGWRATDVLLPIPNKELLLNGNLLPQNSGY